MTCAEVKRALEMATRQRPSELERQVSEHIETCADCRGEREALAQIEGALARLEGPAVSARLAASIMREVAVVAHERVSAPRVFIPLFLAAAGAVLACWAGGATNLLSGVDLGTLGVGPGVAVLPAESPTALLGLGLTALGTLWFARAASGPARSGPVAKTNAA